MPRTQGLDAHELTAVEDSDQRWVRTDVFMNRYYRKYSIAESKQTIDDREKEMGVYMKGSNGADKLEI